QIVSLFNTSGFSLAYYLFTFFAIEASCLVAWGHWRRTLSLKARRFALAFGLLGALRLVLLLAFHNQPPVIKSSLEYGLAVISMGILAWSFSPFFNRHGGWGGGFVAGNTLLALVVFGVNAITGTGNLATIWLIWQIALALFLLGSQIREFSPDQTYTAMGIVVLAVGGAVQLALGDTFSPDFHLPIFNRLGELVAYPILVMAVYQEVIESLSLQQQALKNLSESSQEQIQGLISLFEATRSIIASLNLSEVLDGAAAGVVNALNVDQAAIALPEEGEPGLLRMVAICNPHRKGRREAITFPISEQPAIKHAIERQRRVEINTGYDTPHLKFLFAIMGATDRSGPLVLQPLTLDGQTLGILIVGNAYSRRVLGPTEVRLVETMAKQIAIAIQNARTYQTIVTKSQQLAWTLRNNEQESSRRRAAMEAELKKSREEVTLISQRLYEQETLARKSQKDLTEYQKQASQLSQQLKTAYEKLEKLTVENRRLATLSESRRKQLEQLRQTEEELHTLSGKVRELELEAAEARKLSDSLQRVQEQNRKLIRALRQSRTKIQQLANMPATLTSPQVSKELENIAFGLLISDASGEISRVNPAAARLFGVEGQALVGKNLTDIASTDEWRQAVRQVIAGNTPLLSAALPVEQTVLKATLSPITDPASGQVNGCLVILYDATEEFETQQARDEFVASLAQELRTPMTSIIGYVDLLLGESVGVIGDMQRKFLQRVKANIERMGSLLNDLIGIAAIDAGQLEINPVPLDMAEVIEDAILNAKTQLEEKEIQLFLDMPPQKAIVEADPTCIQQVMTNLLGNAAKSTPANGVIKVQAVITNGRSGTPLTGDAEEQWLRVSITDSGGGIAEKDAEHVFDRFYKADRPLIQGLGETGVGLSIAKYLIEAHGGEIWFDTEMGKGTTFHFALPISSYVNDPWQELDVPPLDLNSDF
ncbi:MAG: PAS domain-containing protein, partial [Caldilineae bacterium]